MAKGKIIILCIAVFIFSLNYSNSCTTSVNKVTESINVFKGFNGIKEKTGQNDGYWVERFLAVCGLKKGNPWCAAMLAFGFDSVGVKAPLSAYSPTWFKQNVIYFPKDSINLCTPDSADVFGIYFKENKRVAHVGIIIHWGDGSYCQTFEGNTNDNGSREGLYAMYRWRPKKNIYIVARYACRTFPYIIEESKNPSIHLNKNNENKLQPSSTLSLK